MELGEKMDLSTEIDAIRDCLIEAGNILQSYQMRDLEISTKKDNSPVSEADRKVNTFLLENLTKILPDAGWLSEESKDNEERLGKSIVWVVDPLDGTKEFISKIPEYCISIGLVFNGNPILGAIYNPATGEGAIGDVQNMKFLSWGGEISSTSTQIPVSRTEYPHPDMQLLLESGLDIVPVGSVAYKLLRVAMSLNPATFTLVPKSEWDICGGVALLKSRGYVYKLLNGNQVKFNERNTLIAVGAIAGAASEVERINKIIQDKLHH